MVNEKNNVIPLLKYRSIFISDIHLGSKGCQAEQLLDFLKNTRSDYLYEKHDMELKCFMYQEIMMSLLENLCQ